MSHAFVARFRRAIKPHPAPGGSGGITLGLSALLLADLAGGEAISETAREAEQELD